MTPVESAVRDFSAALESALVAEIGEVLARLGATAGQAELDVARCRLLSKRQVREVLNCSMRSLDKWMKDGTLPVVWLDRRPRFDPEDVRALCLRRKLRESRERARRAA